MRIDIPVTVCNGCRTPYLWDDAQATIVAAGGDCYACAMPLGLKLDGMTRDMFRVDLDDYARIHPDSVFVEQGRHKRELRRQFAVFAIAFVVMALVALAFAALPGCGGTVHEFAADGGAGGTGGAGGAAPSCTPVGVVCNIGDPFCCGSAVCCDYGPTAPRHCSEVCQ